MVLDISSLIFKMSEQLNINSQARLIKKNKYT